MWDSHAHINWRESAGQVESNQSREIVTQLYCTFVFLFVAHRDDDDDAGLSRSPMASQV